MRHSAVVSAWLALGSLALTVGGGEAAAQGYTVYEHDACIMARAGAGVAAPCSGGSAVFFNPAGIVGATTRNSAAINLTLIAPSNSHTDNTSGLTTDGVANRIPVPAIYLTRQLNERWAVGFGVYALYGLISEWPTDFEGRFLAYRSELRTIYMQPTVAVRLLPDLRLGAGLTYVHSTADLRQRLDLAAQAAAPGVTFGNLGIPVGTDFADAQLEGSSLSMAAHFGVIWDANERLSIGARYLMRQTADISGSAHFTQLSTGIVLGAGNPLGVPAGTPLDSVLAPQFRGAGSLTSQGGSVDVPLPDQFVIGLALTPAAGVRVMFDFQWINWSEFEALEISFARLGTRVNYEDYVDSRGYRLGVDWQASERLALRAGALYHSAAAPAQSVTPLLPEGKRTEGTAGIGYQLGARLRLDLAYQRVVQEDRAGRVTEPTVRGPAGTALNSGVYKATANLFGASVAFSF